jgi:hypothetical protein
MYEPIKHDAKLIRYMSFPKFISLLELGLFIPKSNLFDDI